MVSDLTDSVNSPINGLKYAPEWAGTNVFLTCLPVEDCSDQLFSEELDCIVGVAELRRKTFSSGRVCARASLAEAGLPAVALPQAADGSVRWPEGVIGSLSHTNEWAVSAIAVCAMTEAIGLGVDLERIQPLETGVLKLIATRAERAELAQAGNTRWHSVALFSMKESIYKCLRRSYGRFIEFQEVEILELAGGRPRVRFCSDALKQQFDPAHLELRIAVTPEHVFTLAWLRQRNEGTESALSGQPQHGSASY